MDNNTWTKQEIISNIWKPANEGDELTGNVLEIKDGRYGEQLVLNVGGKEQITPSHKHLQAQFANVKKGDDVKIVYLGEKESGKGNPTQLYECYIKGGA